MSYVRFAFTVIDDDQGLFLLTRINFNPNMNK